MVRFPSHFFCRVVDQVIIHTGQHQTINCEHFHLTAEEAWVCPSSKINKIVEITEIPDNRPGCHSYQNKIIYKLDDLVCS